MYVSSLRSELYIIIIVKTLLVEFLERKLRGLLKCHANDCCDFYFAV